LCVADACLAPHTLPTIPHYLCQKKFTFTAPTPVPHTHAFPATRAHTAPDAIPFHYTRYAIAPFPTPRLQLPYPCPFTHTHKLHAVVTTFVRCRLRCYIDLFGRYTLHHVVTLFRWVVFGCQLRFYCLSCWLPWVLPFTLRPDWVALYDSLLIAFVALFQFGWIALHTRRRAAPHLPPAPHTLPSPGLCPPTHTPRCPRYLRYSPHPPPAPDTFPHLAFTTPIAPRIYIYCLPPPPHDYAFSLHYPPICCDLVPVIVGVWLNIPVVYVVTGGDVTLIVVVG